MGSLWDSLGASATDFMNSNAIGGQTAQGPMPSGAAGVPVQGTGVTWGQLMQAAQQGNNRNYLGAFQTLAGPQQSNQVQMMPGIGQQEGKQGDSTAAVIGLLAALL